MSGTSLTKGIEEKICDGYFIDNATDNVSMHAVDNNKLERIGKIVKHAA